MKKEVSWKDGIETEGHRKREREREGEGEREGEIKRVLRERPTVRMERRESCERAAKVLRE